MALIDQAKAHEDSQLLLTLREVSDLVAHSQDIDETLTNIVRHIKWRFQTDVCSVYTVDRETGELVLSATVGLRDTAVSKVRMALHEGLTGLVAQKKAPVSVENASQHPRYRYFPETGEEQYHSFLGVPLIQGGELQGVLVVQHIEQRRYTPNETLLLVAVAAQLAILVTNARLTRDLSRAVHQGEQPGEGAAPARVAEIHGAPASQGLALGRALRFEEFDFDNPEHVRRTPGTRAEEMARLAAALDLSREDIGRAARHLAGLLGDQFGALMQAQRLMLDDASVRKDLIRLIDEGLTVEQAVVKVCGQYLKAFAKIENPFFYERIYDIKDVFRRLLSHAAAGPVQLAATSAVIVVAPEVSLLELFSCELDRVKGIVVQEGGSYSHVAILARSLGIPMLTHARGLMEHVRNDDELFVDAGAGVLFINPDPTRRAIFQDLVAARDVTWEEPTDAAPPPIRLEATVNLLPEVTRTVHHRAAAVGLYRSEFLELACRYFPSEEEQLEVYRRILRMLEGRPFTLRTLDLRAEKLFGISHHPDHQSQSWDWRLVDRLPQVQDLLRTQLRAALRAAQDGPLRILFPMIATSRQLACALRLLDEARTSLGDEGIPFGAQVPIGIMIEVAAAAMMARAWIRKVDFLCVGSNDLLHSLLGIDRADEGLGQLRTPLDPSYLRTVGRIVRCAHAAGRPVTVCGEAASDPKAILALYALGVDAVSMPPDDIPKARRLFRAVRQPENLAEVGRALARASDTEEVVELLARHFPGE